VRRRGPGWWHDALDHGKPDRSSIRADRVRRRRWRIARLQTLAQIEAPSNESRAARIVGISSHALIAKIRRFRIDEGADQGDVAGYPRPSGWSPLRSEKNTRAAISNTGILFRFTPRNLPSLGNFA